jgi:dTDP-4-amino-4,6-dideoxygalactose transaminase
MLFMILVYSKILRLSRNEFLRGVLGWGVGTAVRCLLPRHRQPIFRSLGTDGEFPVSTRLAQTVLSLRVHPGLRDADLRHIVCAVEAASRSCK